MTQQLSTLIAQLQATFDRYGDVPVEAEIDLQVVVPHDERTLIQQALEEHFENGRMTTRTINATLRGILGNEINYAQFLDLVRSGRVMVNCRGLGAGGLRELREAFFPDQDWSYDDPYRFTRDLVRELTATQLMADR